MLSVVILTKNEEDRIKACLESVKWADEIVVMDSGSKDNTLNIVREYTDKIFKTDLQDFAQTRNQAFEKTVGDWLLYVDADERVLDNLKKEIEALITFGNFSAYAISRRNIILGSEVKYGPYKKDWVVRLFQRSAFETWIGKVHEYAKFKGELGYTENSLLHLTHRDLDQIVLKSLEWSKIDAKLRFDAHHPKMTPLRFFRILITEVFNQGIKRKGFFGGTIGVMDSMLQVFSLFMTYVRLWQLQRNKPLGGIYKEIDKRLIEDEFKYPNSL